MNKNRGILLSIIGFLIETTAYLYIWLSVIKKTKWSEKTNYLLIDAFEHALIKDETLAEIKKWNAFNMMEEKK